MTRPILKLDERAFDTQTHGERFEARMAPVAGRIGAARLGYRVTQLPPGKRAWPFHSHHANEEMFFVLEGRGLLRLADGEHPIRAGESSPRPPAAWRPRTRPRKRHGYKTPLEVYHAS